LTIFVSDTHFGRSPGPGDDAAERDLIACISALRDELDAVFLVGDIFEHYVEYRHLVPKGFVRFQALLATLTDAGIPVTYVVGNHDPWHRDYFTSELGVAVSMDRVQQRLYERDVLITHGDGLGPEAGLYRYLKPLLRHGVPVWIYRSLLPADLGMGIAKWYSRNFRSTSINEVRTRSLRNEAVALLERNAYDVVVMGHSHVPELLEVDGGTYVNCGCWYSDRSLAVIGREGPSLKRWEAGRLMDFAA
jgi:UDP-2,3-diacylglucosamine hydrolase